MKAEHRSEIEERTKALRRLDNQLAMAALEASEIGIGYLEPVQKIRRRIDKDIKEMRDLLIEKEARYYAL